MARLPIDFVVALLTMAVPTSPMSHAAAALGSWSPTANLGKNKR